MNDVSASVSAWGRTNHVVCAEVTSSCPGLFVCRPSTLSSIWNGNFTAVNKRIATTFAAMWVAGCLLDSQGRCHSLEIGRLCPDFSLPMTARHEVLPSRGQNSLQHSSADSHFQHQHHHKYRARYPEENVLVLIGVVILAESYMCRLCM